MSTSARMSTRARWSTPGPPWELRTDWEKCSPQRRCWHRRRSGTRASGTRYHRRWRVSGFALHCGGGVRGRQGGRVGRQRGVTASSKMIDVTGSEPVEYKGFVPDRSVVIPGTYAKTFPAGEFQVPCALIIGKRKEEHRQKNVPERCAARK